MAWGDLAKVSKLLESLGSLSNGWKTKAGKGGKGGKDGKGGGKSNAKQRLCPWADCTAAAKQQPTWGGAAACHCCRRSFANTPPLERLVQWAYAEKLKTSPTVNKAGTDADKSKDKGKEANKDKGKASGKGKGKDLTPSDEELAKVREQRLAELKAAKAGQPPPPPAAQTSVLQDQADLAASRFCAFTPEVKAPPGFKAPAPGEAKWQSMTLDTNTATIMVEAQEAMEEISRSVALDFAPTSFTPTLSPQDELEKLTAATKPCATAADRLKLEDEIGKTKAMVAMGGAPNLIEYLEGTLKTQEAELERLSKKAHGNAMQRAGLVETKAALIKEREARAERALGGKDKGQERKTERLGLLFQLEGAVQAVRAGLLAHDQEYLKLHDQRHAARVAHDQEVDKLLDNLIAARKVDEDADVAQRLAAQGLAGTGAKATDVSSTPPRPQDALVTALAEIKKHQETIANLQAATTQAARGAQQAAAAAAAASGGQPLANAQAEVAKLKAELAEAEAALSTPAAAAVPMDVGVAAPATPVAQPRTPAEAHALRIRYTKDDLVTLERELNKKERTVAAVIVANARTWIERALPPITYEQLLTGAAPAADAIAFLEGMIGVEIWKKFYEGQPTLTIHDFVPAQLASIIQAIALKLDKDIVEFSDTLKDKAATTFDKVEAADMEHREKHTGAYRAY